MTGLRAKAPRAYLTIDDSPSTRMDDLVDFLEAENIPAIFYCRGDLLEQNSASAIRAAQKGFVLANHTFSHQRASEKPLDWLIEDIERAQDLIDKFNATAGNAHKGRYFRFPHIDRGAGGYVVDYDAYAEPEKKELLATFAEGLNVRSLDRPSAEQFHKRDLLQRYLKAAGCVQPFKDVTPRWYNHGEIANAADSLFTFSNCDWMLTARHLGKHPYKSVDDLKQRAVDDPYLLKPGNTGVVLAHDQAEIVDVTIELVRDLKQRGLEFVPV